MGIMFVNLKKSLYGLKIEQSNLEYLFNYTKFPAVNRGPLNVQLNIHHYIVGR